MPPKLPWAPGGFASDAAPVFLVAIDQHQAWTERMLTNFGFDGRTVQELRSNSIYQKPGSGEELEIFRDSDSLRWSRDGHLGVVSRECTIDCNAAFAAAAERLRGLDLLRQHDSFVWGATRVVRDGGGAGIIAQRHLTFHYRVSGIRVGGPGYRTKVTFDDAGEISEVLYLSRPVGQLVLARPPDPAWARQKLCEWESPGFAHDAITELAYLVGPAARAQRYLCPFFVFSSVVEGRLRRRCAPAFEPGGPEWSCFTELGLNLIS